MDKKTIIRNFSRYAYLYDKYADIQKLLAEKLLDQIRENNFKNILEIGCGTGNYTLLLREKFRNAKLEALDISEKMAEIAKEKLCGKEVDFIVADAESIYLEGDFDLITSNACFQWFEDLESALIKYKQRLSEGGIISFSIFGPLTFCELNTVIGEVFKNVSVVASNFVSREKIEKILHENFQEHKIKETRCEETFLCLKELLDKIKYTGIRGCGLGNGSLLSRRIINKLEGIYLERFKQIKATYQVFLCQGRL